MRNSLMKPHFSLRFQFIQRLRHASCPWQARSFHSLARTPTFSPELVWKSLGQFPEIKSRGWKVYHLKMFKEMCGLLWGPDSERSQRGFGGKYVASQGGHSFWLGEFPCVSHRSCRTFYRGPAIKCFRLWGSSFCCSYSVPALQCTSGQRQ